MNKLIEELSKQVDEWFREDGHSYSRPAWNEKFVELIVRECAEYIDILLGDVDNEHYPDGQLLLDRFGVKE